MYPWSSSEIEWCKISQEKTYYLVKKQLEKLLGRKIAVHKSFRILKVEVARREDRGYIHLDNEQFAKCINGSKFHLLNNIGDLLYGRSFHHENHAETCLAVANCRIYDFFPSKNLEKVKFLILCCFSLKILIRKISTFILI